MQFYRAIRTQLEGDKNENERTRVIVQDDKRTSLCSKARGFICESTRNSRYTCHVTIYKWTCPGKKSGRQKSRRKLNRSRWCGETNPTAWKSKNTWLPRTIEKWVSRCARVFGQRGLKVRWKSLTLLSASLYIFFGFCEVMYFDFHFIFEKFHSGYDEWREINLAI